MTSNKTMHRNRHCHLDILYMKHTIDFEFGIIDFQVNVDKLTPEWSMCFCLHVGENYNEVYHTTTYEILDNHICESNIRTFSLDNE